MKNFLVLDTNSKIDLVSLADNEDFLSFAYKALNVDYIETVTCNWILGKDRKLLLIVDEEGKLKNKEENPFATLVSTVKPDVIVGKVMFAKQKDDEIVGLSDADIDVIRTTNSQFKSILLNRLFK